MCPFHYVTICTTCVEAVVDETTDDLAWISVVAPNFTSSHYICHHQEFTVKKKARFIWEYPWWVSRNYSIYWILSIENTSFLIYVTQWELHTQIQWLSRGKAFVHLYGLYGGQNNDPKYFGALFLGTSEYITSGWKTDFADVVKVKDLESGSLSWIIQVGPV